MHSTRSLLAALALLAAATPALAGPVLDHIRGEGVLHCGGVERPGLIAIEDDAKAAGLELDMCRALAFVVLGPEGRLEFRRYDSEKAWTELREHGDDVAFLTAREMIDNGLVGKRLPGPTVFVESDAVMVPEDSPAKSLADLAGKPICYALLQHAQDHLTGWFATHHLDFIRMGFQEDVEMNDGYSVGYCKGVAGEVTTLADTRAAAQGKLAGHHFLPDILAAYPIAATTPTSDAEWAAIVAWTIDTLIEAETPETEYTLGGIDALRINAPELGLAAGWQKRLVDKFGTYRELFANNLGDKSELKLERGLNQPIADGGALEVPHTE